MSGRWDPFRDMVTLREAMNALLEESFVRPRFGSSTLPVDVKETPSAYVITASLPGVAIEDVEIAVQGNSLRISGDRKEVPSDDDSDGRWLLRERRDGAFERSVTLPAPVRPDQASARLDDGVLTVCLPRIDQARPRTIPVQTRVQP